MSTGTKNYFELLGLPERFSLDTHLLDENYKAFLRVFHPDRFAGEDALKQRLAQQMSTRINDARDTLTDPLKRARYLCSLRGLDVNRSGLLSTEFLSNQMDWFEKEESVLESGSTDEKEAFCEKLKMHEKDVLDGLAKAFDAHDDQNSLRLSQELTYWERLLERLS